MRSLPQRPIKGRYCRIGWARRTRTKRGAAFAKAAMPTYDTPEKAVRGFMHLVRYRRGARTADGGAVLHEAEFVPDAERARRALDGQNGWLDPIAVQDVLTGYGIPVARSALAATPDEAAAKATEFGGTVALKVVSPGITHKSRRRRWSRSISKARMQRERPPLPCWRVSRKPRRRQSSNGFLVQEMIRRPGAFEADRGHGG